MKTLIHGFFMCQSMFCAIPSPWQGWDEKAKNKILLFLPLVGLEIGLLWTGLAWLCRLLELPALIKGLVLCAYPYFVTGFMHLDGFMDVTDAVRSWRDLDRRREILKDSHVGSFSVIAVALLILTQFAAAASLPENGSIWMFTLIPAASRCGSAAAVSGLPPMGTSQYAGQKQIPCLIPLCLLAAVIAMGFFLPGGRGGYILLCAAAAYGLSLMRAYHSLKGMNGDIAGYCLSISEAAALMAFALL